MSKTYTLEAVTKLVAKNKRDTAYYITLDHKDGTQETVYKLNCSRQEAFDVFLFVIQQQQAERRKSEPMAQWRVVRLFDANHTQIAQES